MRAPQADRRWSAAVADAVLAAVAKAARPIILAGPQLSNVSGRDLLARLEVATKAPAVILESPRGIADATLGAFSDLARRADLVVLLGKALDFTVKWAAAPAFDPGVRLIVIDPDAAMVDRAAKEMGDRLILGLYRRLKNGRRDAHCPCGQDQGA